MIQEIKQKMLEALAKIDLDKLTFQEIEIFTRVLGNLSDNKRWEEIYNRVLDNSNHFKQNTISDLSTKDEK